ncbi:MAG: BatA domain-containing protein [Vicinamibacterales bacterium]
MSIAWLLPGALAGMALVALPIAIHLLVRQHARTQLYPSLRFLRETQLAAFRRRTIQDAALLLCRAAVLALAAIALAGPVLQTPARTAAFAKRVSRAAVAIDQRPVLSDALADAVRWLNRQPPSARQIVISGAFRRGDISGSDLAAVPADIGIRFEPVAASATADSSTSILVRRGGTLQRLDRRVHFGTDSTEVSDGVSMPVSSSLVTIVAKPADTSLAEAALRAAVDAGVPWRDFDHRVLVVWDGADESQVSRGAADARIIRTPVPSPSSAAADAVRSALAPDLRPAGLIEPVMITAEELAAWSRPPGPPASDAPLADEGDRRWIWTLALALLAVEWWLRRDATAARSEPAAVETEARVA